MFSKYISNYVRVLVGNYIHINVAQFHETFYHLCMYSAPTYLYNLLLWRYKIYIYIYKLRKSSKLYFLISFTCVSTNSVADNKFHFNTVVCQVLTLPFCHEKPIISQLAQDVLISWNTWKLIMLVRKAPAADLSKMNPLHVPLRYLFMISLNILPFTPRFIPYISLACCRTVLSVFYSFTLIFNLVTCIWYAPSYNEWIIVRFNHRKTNEWNLCATLSSCRIVNTHFLI